jgi:hypothetical protein
LWEESFQKVATIIIPKQDFDTAERRNFDESLAFNPWHSLPEHAPLGKVNEVRRLVYLATANLRRRLNHHPHKEPTEEEFIRIFPE